MRLFVLLLVLITGFSYAQDSMELSDEIVEDYTPTDRPVVDDDQTIEHDSSEVSSYDYDY